MKTNVTRALLIAAAIIFSSGSGADAARLRGGGRNLVGVFDAKPAGYPCTFNGDCISKVCEGPFLQRKCAAGKLADGANCDGGRQAPRNGVASRA